MKRIVQILSIFILSLLVVIGFQNCSPKNLSGNNQALAGNAKKSRQSPAPAPAPAPAPSSTASPVFTFTISDPDNLLGSKRDLVLANAQAAGAIWATHFNSSASIEVLIEVLQTPNNMFGGSSVGKTYIGTYNGLYVAEENAAYELRTGMDPNGATADISIWVDPDYLNNEMWLDPQPTLRVDPVPDNREDGVSVFLHEMGHALGFNGYWPDKSVPLPAGWTGVYDKFISIDERGMAWYNGPNAKAAYGEKPIPLCIANNYHMGNIQTADIDGFKYFLMTGNYFMYGHRYDVDSMVIAVLKDLGIPAK